MRMCLEAGYVRFVHAAGQSEEPSVRGLASQPPEKSGHFPNTLGTPRIREVPKIKNNLHTDYPHLIKPIRTILTINNLIAIFTYE